MASLRETAQRVLQEARDGIAWIAFYKEGRGWGAECFWPEYHDKSNDFCHDEDDLAELRDILKNSSAKEELKEMLQAMLDELESNK